MASQVGSKSAPVRKGRKHKQALPNKPSSPEVVNFTVPHSGWTRDRLIAKIAVDGTLANATTLQFYAYGQMGEHGSMQQCVDSLREKIRDSQNGSSDIADELLIPQAAALNVIANELMRRAGLNLGVNLEAVETYMRLALKAQSQCRTTLESLAKIKNPPNVTFVKQANVAQGHQQVNNGVPAPSDCSARTEKAGITPIELLENNHGEWVVPATTGQAVGGNQAMAAVEMLNGTTDSRRKKQGKP